ncbi:MAG: hypothetical protein ACI81P_001047 [Neolewinella sp.]
MIHPDERHQLSNAEFKEIFVDEYPDSMTRSKIYSDYASFTSAFAEDVTESFAQWLGGSFYN